MGTHRVTIQVGRGKRPNEELEAPSGSSSSVGLPRSSKPWLGLYYVAGGLLGPLGLLFAMAAAQTTRTETSGHLWWKETTEAAVPAGERIGFTIAAVLLLTAAVACIVVAVRLQTRPHRVAAERQRLSRYATIVRGSEAIGIDQVAAIVGASQETTLREITKAIEGGLLRDCYVDHAANRLVNQSYVPVRSSKIVVVCDGCGQSNDVIVGVPKPCTSCGRTLTLDA